MLRAVLGQAVGVASVGLWLPLTVYFMSRAATPNVSDSGNYFLYFALVTVAFVAVMTMWRRAFGESADA